MNTHIATIDLVIVGLYFIIVLGIGVVIARRTETGDDLFLGGRSFGWGLIGLSLFASNISSTTLIGLSGAAYSTGIVQSVYEWMSGIPLIVAAVVFVPLYLRSQITTIPEFLGKRFDRRSQVFFSAITIFISIVVDTAGGLYAGALVLQTFFPNLVLWQTTLVLAVVAGVYTAFGGLKAVVYTDAMQALILIIGCSVLTFNLYGQLDFSWNQVVAAAPEDFLSVVRPIDDTTIPWPGLLLGVPILGFWYWATNQYIVQRVLGAKDIRHARWGVLLGGFLKIIPLFIMVIPGTMAISLFPGLDNADAVFPTAVLSVLPVGLVGLVLAGLISAIMSSVDSTLNSASTLIVIDFIKPAQPSITPKRTAYYGRVATFVLMAVAAIWAPLIAEFGGLWSYMQQVFAVVVPPIAVIFLVGVFYRRGNGHGAFWTLMLGTLLGTVTFMLSQFGWWDIHYTITIGIMVAMSAVIFVAVSNSTAPPPAEKVAQYTFRPEMAADRVGGVLWYQDYRLYAAFLLVTIGWVLVVFW